MKKTIAAILDFALLILGLRGEQLFVLLHGLLLAISPVYFSVACTIIVGAFLIWKKNKPKV